MDWPAEGVYGRTLHHPSSGSGRSTRPSPLRTIKGIALAVRSQMTLLPFTPPHVAGRDSRQKPVRTRALR